MKAYHALFISDTHLGLPAARADLLLDFLKHHRADKIYLVGDIFDLWALQRKPYWPKVYNEVLSRLYYHGMHNIYYLPGNHDDFIRNFTGSKLFGKIEIVDSVVHQAIDGRRLLVLHGDQLDHVATHIHWLALLGDWAYDKAIDFSAWLSKVRKKLGYKHWSFSQWAKARIKGAVSFLEGYEALLRHAAKKKRCSGVVCGHIHTASIKDDNGFLYINCGDWVESFTAIGEKYDGTFEIIQWLDKKNT